MHMLWGFAQFLLATGFSFAVLCALASHLRFQRMTRAAAEGPAEHIDPDDAFQARVADLLGTAGRLPEPFVLVLTAPDGLEGIARQHGAPAKDGLLKCIEERVRGVVRSGDAVMRCGLDRVGLLLHVPRRAAEPVVRRVLARIEEEPCRCDPALNLRVTANAGVASHPENGDRVRQLLEQAERALETAWQGGGPRWVLAPEPADGAAPAPGRADEAAAPRAQSGLLDPLTGVLRPERLSTALSKYVARFRNDGQPVSLVLMSVDSFDRYNEHYGNEAGDQILKGLAEVLQANVREEDLLARRGGEEFLVALPAAPRQALLAAQRLMGVVKRTSFRVDNRSLRITLSMGVAGCPEHGTSPRRLVEAAAAAIQHARGKGQGVCILYDRSMRARHPSAQTHDVF